MIAAVTMVRNEQDVIAGTLRHMADEGVDLIIVADNLSTDDTRPILESLNLPCELLIVDDSEPGYYQSRKMSHLAQLAGERGARWVIPFDADELWTAETRLADHLNTLPTGCKQAQGHVYTFSPTGQDPPAVDPMLRIQWRTPTPLVMRKVAFRWSPGAVIAQGNHSVKLPVAGIANDSLSVWHYPYRSAEQFVRKARQGAAAYQATDLPESEGAHWRGYGAIAEASGDEACADIYREWFSFPTTAGMVWDPFVYRRWQPENVIVVSPHLDDAVLSCGAMLATRPQTKTVVTVCAGAPRSGVTDYDIRSGFTSSGEAVAHRRNEDTAACLRLEADAVHLDFLDSQYGETLDVDMVEAALRDAITERLGAETVVCVPLGIGHPDHVAVAEAALKAVLDLPVTLLVYEELPYRVERPELAVDTARNLGGWLRPMRQDPEAKTDAVACYESQRWALHNGSLSVPERFWQCDA